MATDPTLGAPDRRAFLTTTSAVLAGGALVFGDWRPARAAAGDLPKRQLGRTGLNVTCLAFGGIQLTDASHRAALEHAIDSGINYVHTCPGYTGGRSIQVVGEVMRTRRDKVYLAVKTEPGDVDRCLQILNTDRIDVLIPDTTDMSEQAREAYNKCRQAGKVRFFGFAAHDRMADRLRDCVKAGWREVMLCKYNLDTRGELDPVINQATAAGMGIMAMKVAGGGNGSVPQKLKDLLKGNTNLACVTPGMNAVSQIDQNIAAVCEAIAELKRGDVATRPVAFGQSGVCTSCGECARACPQAVALMDYLRADLYRGRGDVKLAQDLVRAIPARHSLAACTGCGRCGRACRHQVDVLGVARGVA